MAGRLNGTERHGDRSLVLSVALCTYNGARFLHEQLASVGAQTRPPDELIVCDDGSADSTLDLARAFAAAAPFPVRVEANTARLGSTANFARAISLCRGDVIALADQDDVWLPDKLARLEQALGDHAAAGLVFSDATMVGPNLRAIGYTLWDAIGFGAAERDQFRRGQAFDCLLRRFRVTGATMAFRSHFRELVLPIPAGWVHDAWIALLVAAAAPLVPVAEPLILYRQHPAQQLGERKRGLLAQYRVARAMDGATFRGIADRFAEALDRLRGRVDVPGERIHALEAKVRHARVRARMREPGAWRLPGILREWRAGSYARYSRGWQAVAQDLFLR